MNLNLLWTFLTIFILSFVLQVKGQSHFKKEFTDSLHNHWDTDIIETPDSNFVIMGNESTGLISTGGFLYKITKNGQFIWRKSYRYHPNPYPVFKSICLVDSGEFIVTAILDSLDTYGYIKFDSSGNILSVFKWDNFSCPTHAYVHNTVQRIGSSLVFFGNENINALNARPVVAKTDLFGNVVWSRRLTIGALCNEKIVDMDIDSFGNIYLDANDWNFQCSTQGATKLIKMDSLGNIVWANQYENGFEIVDVKCISNRRIILAGDNFTLFQPAFAIEIDSSGTVSYAKQYSWSINTQSTHISFDADTKENVFVAKIYGPLSFIQQYIIVTDSDGTFVSANAYDDSLSNSYSEVIKKCKDGGWLLAGVEIIKFDSLMNHNCPPTNLPIIESVIPVTQNSFAITVDTMQASLINVNYQVVIDSLALTTEEYCLPVGIPENDYQSFSLFPNPAFSRISIQLESGFNKEWHYEISDLTGRVIVRGNKNQGNEGSEIDLAGIKSGLYFIQLFSGKSILTQKFIKN